MKLIEMIVWFWPSHFESFGTIALEAMSRSRIVIVSTGTGISNWPELTAGLIVQRSGETLADTVRRVKLFEPDARHDLAAEASRAAIRFDERNLQEWEALLVELMASLTLMDALISIHDVMPRTLDRVERIMAGLPDVCRQNLVLLVVPGLDWSPQQIDRLRSWQQTGLILAGHGWTHHAATLGGWYHRLHSIILSRRAAEHLSLQPDQILALMEKNHAWFAAHNLTAPDYYVPPAWALGPVSTEQIATLPFKYIEFTSGLLHVPDGTTRRLPLLGFEADTALRQGLLTISNGTNLLMGKVLSPIRISIHPFDHEYRLADQMRRLCQRVVRNVHYHELFSA